MYFDKLKNKLIDLYKRKIIVKKIFKNSKFLKKYSKNKLKIPNWKEIYFFAHPDFEFLKIFFTIIFLLYRSINLFFQLVKIHK